MKDRGIEERAKEYCESITGNSDNRYIIQTYVAGEIRGATEERERGKRFGKWMVENVRCFGEDVYHVISDEYSDKSFTGEEIFNRFLEEEKEVTN